MRLSILQLSIFAPLVGRATQEIDRGKEHDLEGETDHEELLMRGRLKSEKAEAEVQLPNEIENVSGREITDIHDHVDDREGNGALRGGGIFARGRE